MKKYRIFYALMALLVLLSCLRTGSLAQEEPEPVEEETTEEGASESQETEVPEEAEEAEHFRDYSKVLLQEQPYEADCKSALLIEMGTNTILYSQEPDARRYPASLTKIMTCLVALEKCEERGKSLDDLVTVSASAFDGLDEGGSSAGIQPGDQLSIRDLLYCMMLESANESCNIIAEALAGDVATFVGWMNDRAKELGCTQTHYANAHGLHASNHYTSARDLALIVEAALKNEEFNDIIGRASYTISSENYSGKRDLVTTNYLLMEYSDYYYSLARGVKTGYTSAAGRCLITTASDSNLRLLAIILGAEDNEFAEDGLRYRSFVEAKNLLKYGFANFDYAQVVSKLVMTAQVVVDGGDANYVVIYPSEDISCLLPEEYDKEKITTSWALYDDASKLEAPLEARQKVGTITVSYNGFEIASTTLETLTAVKKLNTVENMVADTGDFFRTTLPQLLRQYWWVFPAVIALIVFLVVVLIVRNSILRARRRRQIRRRRQQRAQQ